MRTAMRFAKVIKDNKSYLVDCLHDLNHLFESQSNVPSLVQSWHDQSY